MLSFVKELPPEIITDPERFNQSAHCPINSTHTSALFISKIKVSLEAVGLLFYLFYENILFHYYLKKYLSCSLIVTMILLWSLVSLYDQLPVTEVMMR